MIRVPIDYRSVKQQKTALIDTFLGADFSSSVLKADVKRSPLTENLINRYGNNHKRYGWSQIAEVGTGNINGFIKFEETISGVTKEYFLVYSGTTFYKVEITETGIGYVTTALDTTNITPANLVDRRVQFYEQEENIFIVGAGDFIVFTPDETGEYELHTVFEHEDTYVPTTTISIDYEGYVGTSLRASLEAVNMMTRWRKNSCRGAVGSNVESPVVDRVFHLDSEIYDTYVVGPDIVVAHITNTYQPSVGDPVVEELTGIITDPYGTITLYDESDVYRGTIVNNGLVAVMTLEDTITEPVTADDNIVIEFLTDANNSSKINDCQFGVLFGVDGVTSQLFVSGNSSHKNFDYFSYPLDFTYWPDINYREVGNSAIKGYLRISDGTLAILKEKKNFESSVYFRTGTLSWDDDETYCETSYVEIAGFSGRASVSPWATAVLAGDPVFLSESNVFGIVLSENIATDERYARERSLNIEKKLKEHTNLSEAVATVFDDKYYLVIDDVCYVADSRFKSKRTETKDDAFEYEWWYWTNIPARVISVQDEELYFGTDDGRLCVFGEDFVDLTFENIASGNISFQPMTDKVVFNSALEFVEGDTIKFDESTLYECVFKFSDVSTISGNTLTISASEGSSPYYNLSVLNDEEELILVGINQAVHTHCFVSDVNFGSMTFDLVDANGDPIDIGSLADYSNLWLLRVMTGTELFIDELDEANYEFKVTRHEGGVAMKFTFYSATIDDETFHEIELINIHRVNVVAKWYTPVLDLGTTLYSKTLLSMTLSVEQENQSSIEFGFQTNNVIKNLSATDQYVGGTADIDLSGLDFQNFTLQGFATSYTKKVKCRNFNYISFHFESDNDQDCAINNFSFNYQINNQNRGVR